MNPVKRRLIWLERILFALGIVMLGWCLVVSGEAWAVQRADVRLLEESLILHPSPSFVGSRVITVARGTPLAQLQIPRIGLSAVVLEGDDDRTLRLGPGHIAGTAMPGRTGNIAIAGHRDTFFRPLHRIRVGDEITLVAPNGRFRYRVSSLRVVSPDDVSVLDPTVPSLLTLVTCYPFWMLGHAPDRFIVRASLIGATPHRDAQGQGEATAHSNTRR